MSIKQLLKYFLIYGVGWVTGYGAHTTFHTFIP